MSLLSRLVARRRRVPGEAADAGTSTAPDAEPAGGRDATDAEGAGPGTAEATPADATRDASAPASDRGAPVPCPSCATLLDPPPVRNRRCPRCRQPIVVRRHAGRTVYLTEASVAVFELERQRDRDRETWTRARDEWLRLAAAIGVPAAAIARVHGRTLDEAAVAASRGLYEDAARKGIRAATRARRWDEAARLGIELAAARHRAAGSPAPPEPDTTAIHAAAMAARLRTCEPGGSHAELVGGACCPACRADDGKLFRIADELRTPRLPHPGCPRGLCPCDWWLGTTPEKKRRRPRAG